MNPRVRFVSVDERILSSYQKAGGTGGDRATLKPLHTLSGGKLTPDAAEALAALSLAVEADRGDLRITDALRSAAAQAKARERYERWLNDGKPRGDDYDSSIHKNAFVARPGRSFHNAGRAIDIHVGALNFGGLPKDSWLDRFWEIATPLGWRPVIREPDEGAREAWHFDFMGPWLRVCDRLGYEQAAMGATLDVLPLEESTHLFPRAQERLLQAQLHRAGYDVGDIDGYLGIKTEKGLTAAGLRLYDGLDAMVEVACGLPDYSPGPG